MNERDKLMSEIIKHLENEERRAYREDTENMLRNLEAFKKSRKIEEFRKRRKENANKRDG